MKFVTPQVVYCVQHIVTTGALAYLMMVQSGARHVDALISTFILTLRDWISLSDSIFASLGVVVDKGDSVNVTTSTTVSKGEG